MTDLQGAMKAVDAQEREDRVGGAGAPFRPQIAPSLRAVLANPAEIEVERLATEKAQEVAAAVEHGRACHALAAAMRAAAHAKQRAGADLTVWTWRDAEAIFEVSAQLVEIEEAAISASAQGAAK